MQYMRKFFYIFWFLLFTEQFLRPWVGGIAVGPKGAYSVALSGGYDDDVDIGEGL